MLNKIIKNEHLQAFAIFILVLIVVFSAVFIDGKVFSGGDSTASKGITKALTEYHDKTGDYPLWQPYIFSGMPAFESISYTRYVYFPGFITKIFGLLGMSALVGMILHYLLGAMGAYLLLRFLGGGLFAGVLSGLTFMLTPFYVVMMTAGHGSQMMTASYLPWLIYGTLRVFKTPDIGSLLLLAIVAGFQLQRGHVQVAYYGWMSMGLYVLVDAIYRAKNKDWEGYGRIIATFSAALILGLGLAMALYWPSLHYADASIRGGSGGAGAATGLAYDYATNWSFPPKELIALLVPDWFGFGGQNYWGTRPFTEHTDYFGVIPFILAIFAFISTSRKQLKIFFAVGIGLSLLVGFGKYFPFFFNLLFDYLPYFNKFRVPSMILILTEVYVAILAGLGVQAFYEINQETKTKMLENIKWFTIGSVSLLIIVMMAKTFISTTYLSALGQSPKAHPRLATTRFDMFYLSLITSISFAAVTFGLIHLWLKKNITTPLLMSVLIVLAAADLMRIDFRFTDNAINPKRVKAMENASPTVKYLQSMTQKERGRIFPVNAFFASNIWSLYGLESIGGYHPAKLQSYQSFFDETRIDQQFILKYYDQSNDKVRLRTIDEIDPVMRATHLNWLQQLNVKTIVSPYPIPEPEFTLINKLTHYQRGQKMDAYIYHFENAYPRVWIADEVSFVSKPELTSISNKSFSSDHQAFVVSENLEIEVSSGTIRNIDVSLQDLKFDVETASGAFVVLSDIYYKNGWIATLDDNQEISIYQTNALLKGVLVPKGEHRVSLTYMPSTVVAGLSMTFISTLILLGFGVFLIIQKTRKKE